MTRICYYNITAREKKRKEEHKNLHRMKNLIQQLNEANQAYYIEASPIMTDKEYDVLYDELQQLEQETGIVYPNSPTQNVGYAVSVSQLSREQHAEPMLSMEKTKSVETLEKWIQNGREACLSWKLDGLTVVLTYNKGVLQKAVTRGDGVTGEVITHNAARFTNLPICIPYKEELVIRGEALITYPIFELINSELPDEEKYKNPRNLASGSIRQLNSDITAQRYVIFKAFRLITKLPGISDYYDEQMKWLESLGFDCVENVVVSKETISDTVQDFSNRVTEIEYPVDGLVLTYRDTEYGKSLGRTAKAPKHSIAFKWADETVETVLQDVQWQVSRTGLINPVAIFSPVELEGTTVKQATLNNVSFIEKMELGIGDTITVYKANMIIPAVDDNLTRSNTLKIPDVCPVCGGPTKIVTTKQSKMLYCTNPKCQAQLVGKLSHFCSADAMDIRGISDLILRFLVRRKWVSTYADLYELGQYRTEWSNIVGFKQRSVDQKIAAIDNRSKNVDPVRFLYGLGIPGIGKVQSEKLIKEFSSIDNLFQTLDERKLGNIEGFGPVLLENLYRWKEKDFYEMDIPRLLEHIQFANPVSTKSVGTESKINGISFCITGNVQHFKNRKELQQYIQEQGGIISSGVSVTLDYLINNDINSQSSKNKKAKELNIPIINEHQLLEMCGE